MKEKIQLLEKEVSTEGERVQFSEELDRNYKYVTGISILDNIGDKHLLASSSVDGQELFPKNFEIEFLQSNSSVAPDQRFFTFEKREAAGKKIELDFLDVDGVNFPYTVRIYLRLSNEV